MKRNVIILIITFLFAACVPQTAASQATAASSSIATPTPTPSYASAPETGVYAASDFIATEILGRPTDTSITVNVVPAGAMEVYYEYGLEPGSYAFRTDLQSAQAGEPIETLISDLLPNMRYYYRLRYNGAAGPEGTFITQRAPGSTFTFAIQADSHLNTDKHCNPELYAITMQNVALAQPDFFIDLGDTFRTDKLKTMDQASINQLYLDQRPFFGLAAAPLFLVNGNHEMEWGWRLDGKTESPTVWSALARNTYYPQPSPDGFYTGDALEVDSIGLLRDYYAWTWGDALFVVIDPYWSTQTDPKQSGNNWDWTLGEEQYQWFRDTLEGSDAAYKFVFTHHVLGETRGGAEMAKYFEWGGYDRNGNWGFDQHRPGWGLPIHQVMVENGVTIFFQGHDHLYAREELDGVIYQTLPMPGNTDFQIPNQDAYPSAITRPESGYLKVSVSPANVLVEYIRSFRPQDESTSQQNGMVEDSYTIPAQ